LCENFKVLKHPTDLKLNDVVATASSPKFKFYKMKTLSRNEMKNVMGGNAPISQCYQRCQFNSGNSSNPVYGPIYIVYVNECTTLNYCAPGDTPLSCSCASVGH